MSSLSSQVSELESVRKLHNGVRKWAEEQRAAVAESGQRPAKFRAEAAQLDINIIMDLRQSVAEKTAVVDDLEAREQMLGTSLTQDGQKGLRTQLEELDQQVKETILVKHIQLYSV
jgi:hypothetical protein